MNESEILTLKAKEAIRSYMLKLVALPGVALALLAFSLGYFISDVAQSKASFEIGNEMRQELSEILHDIYADVRDFTEETAKEKVRAQEALSQVADLEEEASKIHLSLEAMRTFRDSQQFVTDVGQLLKDDSIFQDSLKTGILKECRICFRETEGSSQCQGNRSSCSGWSSSPSWTTPFRDDTDNRGGGCKYQWKLECR